MSVQAGDQKERDVARTWVGGPVLVEAGAGTGKTTLLVDRVLHLIRGEGVPITEMAVITFTKKATVELRERIRRALLSAVAEEGDGAARERLQDALREIESARISTIHSFALGVLREFSMDAGLRPDIMDVDEAEYEARRDSAWRRWLMGAMGGEDQRLRDFLELGFSAADLEKIRDAMLALPEFGEGFPRSGEVSPDDLWDSVEEAFSAWEEFAEEHCLDRWDKAFDEVGAVESWLRGLKRWSAVEMLREFWQPRVKMNKRVGARGNWLDLPDGAGNSLVLLRRGYDRFMEKGAAIIGCELLAGVVSLVRGFVESFEAEARDAGVLSYADMLFLATRLVRENPAARARIRRSVRHFLVDEFQDTDPLQVELVFLLAGEDEGAGVADWRAVRIERANLFLVGDPKQSIYRFRRADIAIYQEVKEKIQSLPTGRVPVIQENFRSVPGVIDFVNGVFSEVIAPQEGAQPAYVPLRANRESAGPGVFLLRSRDGGDDAKMSEAQRRAREAAHLAAGIRALVEERKVEVREDGAPRPIAYQDVAVLFRTRTGYPEFEDAFRRAGVPCVSDGGRRFYDKFEVGAAISVLLAVLRPGDPLALATALRSPLYGFSDEDVARRFLKAPGVPPALEEAVREICLLHEKKKGWSARALLAEIFRRTQAFELFLSSSGGEQRVANLWKLLDMAFEFTRGGRRGTDEFAAHLEAQYELGKDAREPEAFLDVGGAPAVRFMTIHQAKGLEFPAVALADLDGGLARRQETWIADRRQEAVELRLGASPRYLDSTGYADALEREGQFQEAEDKRQLYVAATRAKDCLIWPMFHNEKSKKRSCWALMKEMGMGPAEICAMESESVSILEVSPEAQGAPAPIFRLGADAFAPENGDAESLPAARSALDAELRRLKEPPLSQPPLAPSTLVEEDALRAAEPEASWEEDAESPTGGRAFGQLVHDILARLEPPDAARLESLREEGAARARALGLGAGETRLAVEMIRRSIDRGVLARAAASPRRWRELPFLFLMGGRLLRGLVDLVFEEGGKLVVADFKTDQVAAAEAPARALAYQNQVGAYAMGLEAATGAEVGELVFSFLRPGVDVPLSVDAVLREGVRQAVGCAE